MVTSTLAFIFVLIKTLFRSSTRIMRTRTKIDEFFLFGRCSPRLPRGKNRWIFGEHSYNPTSFHKILYKNDLVLYFPPFLFVVPSFCPPLFVCCVVLCECSLYDLYLYNLHCSSNTIYSRRDFFLSPVTFKNMRFSLEHTKRILAAIVPKRIILKGSEYTLKIIVPIYTRYICLE
jgi:hypothetical protein